MDELTPGPSPHRDRLIVHLVWEAFLAVLTLGVVVALFVTADRISLSTFLGRAALIGLAASAVAVSLRTASPNLAVGAIAMMTGTIGVELTNEGELPVTVAMAIAVGIALIVSVVIAVISVGLGVPTWATTIAAAVIIVAVLLSTTGATGSILTERGGDSGIVWFVVFLLVSVGGALAWWLVPGLRPALSANRDASRPGRWPGLRASLGVSVGIVVSGLLAALAGVWNALLVRGVFVGDGGFSTTYLALGVALLGATSIAGRRAGVLGTVLATLLVTAALLLLQVQSADGLLPRLLPGLAIIVGLGIGRAVEAISDILDRQNSRAAALPSSPVIERSP